MAVVSTNPPHKICSAPAAPLTASLTRTDLPDATVKIAIIEHLLIHHMSHAQVSHEFNSKGRWLTNQVQPLAASSFVWPFLCLKSTFATVKEIERQREKGLTVNTESA